MHSFFLQPGRMPAASPQPIANQPWPLVIQWVARHRRAGEAGAGDTLERLLHGLGADRAAHWWERLAGRTCGCQDRKVWLNGRYPYIAED